MNELEALKEDLYKLIGELRYTNHPIQCKEDEFVQLGRNEASDRLNEILRSFE